MRIVAPQTDTPKPDATPFRGTEPSSPAQWPGSQIMADPITARVLFSVWSGDPAVVVPSPPGAGKTRRVALLAAALAHRASARRADRSSSVDLEGESTPPRQWKHSRSDRTKSAVAE